MAIIEYDACLKYRDVDGKTTVIYPITKAENVKGAIPITSGGTGASDKISACESLGATPAFSYGTEDITPGSTSEKNNGTIHFVYTTVDDVWDRVKSVFITVDGVWRLVWDTSYPLMSSGI